MIAYLIAYFFLSFSCAHSMDSSGNPVIRLIRTKDLEAEYTLEDANYRLGNPLFFEEDDTKYTGPIDTICFKEDRLDDADFSRAFQAAYDCDANTLIKLVNETNINQTNSRKHPIIFSTIKKNFDDPAAKIEDILEFLIDKGATINVVPYGHTLTAFEYATRLSIKNKIKNFRAVEYLISQGANPFCIPYECTSAYDIVLKFAMKKNPEKYPQAQALLDLFKSKAKTLHEAILSCNLEKIDELANPDSVKQLDLDAKPPLYLAVARFNEFNKSQTLLIIKKLLEKGASVNEGIQKMPLPGNTPLIVATIISIIRGDSSMLHQLLTHNGNPYLSIIPGFTPSAYDVARGASRLTKKDIAKACKQGYKLEIEQIQEHTLVAANIVSIFKLYCPQDKK